MGKLNAAGLIITSTSDSDRVPYIGATTDVNLGAHRLTSSAGIVGQSTSGVGITGETNTNMAAYFTRYEESTGGFGAVAVYDLKNTTTDPALYIYTATAGQALLISDTNFERISINSIGTISWWNPIHGGVIDTNLYRDSANVLKTDDKFTAAAGISSVNNLSIIGNYPLRWVDATEVTVYAYIHYDGNTTICNTAGTILIQPTAGTTRLGTNISYTEIENDGTMVFHGNAVVWDDLRIVPGSIDRPGVSDPTYRDWQPGGSGTTYKVLKFNQAQFGNFTCQFPHGYKQGSNVYAHVHWTPGDRGTTEDTKTVAWKIDYSWANIEGVFLPSATLDLTDTCTYASLKWLYSSYKRSSKMRGYEFNITLEEFKDITSQNCHYCNIKPSNEILDHKKRLNGAYVYNGIDRIVNEIGYTKENIVPCCKTCNYAKREMTQKQFLDWIKKVYDNNFHYQMDTVGSRLIGTK